VFSEIQSVDDIGEIIRTPAVTQYQRNGKRLRVVSRLQFG
jgi:hypothetical protein